MPYYFEPTQDTYVKNTAKIMKKSRTTNKRREKKELNHGKKIKLHTFNSIYHTDIKS